MHRRIALMQKQKVPLISYLVNNKYVEAKAIAMHASNEFGVPVFDLSAFDKSALPTGIVSEKLIHQHHALPLFKRGNRLFVALSDPTNFQALDDIKFHTRLSTETILVEEDKLVGAIDSFLEAADTSMTDLLDSDLDNIDISDGQETSKEVDTSDVDDAPIVRFVNKILLDAIKKGASDIHLEPYEKLFAFGFVVMECYMKWLVRLQISLIALFHVLKLCLKWILLSDVFRRMDVLK